MPEDKPAPEDRKDRKARKSRKARAGDTSAIAEEAEPSFGAWLRGHRESRGVQLEAIAQWSKINIRYLELLEEDRFDLLPASIFVKGFLREYARVVGLDTDEVLNFYMAVAPAEEPRRIPLELERPRLSGPSGFTLAILVVLALIAAAIIWVLARNGGAPDVVEAMAPPVTEAAPELPPPVAEPERALRVTLEFSGTSWVDVQADGERTVSELRVQGESLTVAADREVRLKLSRVGSATIEVNGEPLAHEAADDEEIVIDVPEDTPSG